MFEQGKAEESDRSFGGRKVATLTTPPPPPPTSVTTLHYNPYPPPLAKYTDVIANPKLFIDTLEKLHAAMGTKFMIPIIGGRDLDLHKLFLEVTTRGGIEKILREKRWKEVTATYNFPSTATNASFVLRKYYYLLLHHYEQIYFFKAQGWTPLPHGTLQSGHGVPIAVHGTVSTVPLLSQAATIQPQGMRVADSVPPPGAPSSVGTQVTGVIDGKFESGYLVTVTVGTQKLKGVLYQVAPTANPIHQVPQPQNTGIHPNQSHTIGTSLPGPPFKRRRRRRKKSEMKKRDPAHPKPNRSGYNFFFAEQHARLKPLYRGRDREISRIIGELWNNLKENDKSVYQEKAVNDKERYRREMEDYRERLMRAGQVISDAVPIQQRLPGTHAERVDVDAKDETGMESSEMYENEDDEEDNFCSMSGSEYEDDAANKDEGHLAAEASQGAGQKVESSNVDAQRSVEEAAPFPLTAGKETEESRAQGHAFDATPDNQQEKICTE